MNDAKTYNFDIFAVKCSCGECRWVLITGQKLYWVVCPSAATCLEVAFGSDTYLQLGVNASSTGLCRTPVVPFQSFLLTKVSTVQW